MNEHTNVSNKINTSENRPNKIVNGTGQFVIKNTEEQESVLVMLSGDGNLSGEQKNSDTSFSLTESPNKVYSN